MITEQIPVDKDFDRIAALPRADMVTIASRTKKTLQIIILESVFKIDVSGLPFKGPQDASVAVFSSMITSDPTARGLIPAPAGAGEISERCEACVKHFPPPMHNFARKAAVAALAAGKQGNFGRSMKNFTLTRMR